MRAITREREVGGGGVGGGGGHQMCRRINGVRKVSKERYVGTGIKASPVPLFSPFNVADTGT